MNFTPKNIKEYVEEFLNNIFNENIIIDIQGKSYLINNKKRIKIYTFWNKSDEELLSKFDGYSLDNDYIGSIFFFLSGYWDYIHNYIKDNYGRFPAKQSFNFKSGILEEPIVDILVSRLASELSLTYKNSFSRPRIFLTHDIDHLDMLTGLKFIKSIGADVLKRKNLIIALDKVRRKIKNKDPFSVNSLLNIHKKYNSKGTFFFMPGFQPKETTAGYDPLRKKRKLIELKKEILETEGSIGIHYDSRYLIENRMSKDLRLLEKVFEESITSGRAHFLIFDITKSFDIYEKSGLKLDTTCSYADMIGFRFGTSYPFKPYNFKKNISYNFWEVPLIAMEATLQNDRYMKLSPEQGFEKIKELMNKIKMYNGVFTLLWHNTSFYTSEWKNWEWVYDETIKYGKKNGFEFVNSDQLIDISNLEEGI